MRKPIASDSFYPSSPMELYEQVRKFFVSSKKEDVEIAIAPHAGYAYSGKCAGEVYSRFKTKEKVDTIILLGPNHSGIGPKIGLSFQNFLTPFGKIENDLDFGKLILRKSEEENLDVGENEDAHNKEHSLEVQLPFLQTVFGKEIKITPIILKDFTYEECMIFAKIIYFSIKSLNQKIKIIISSDFSHYGKLYGFIPFENDVREKLYNLDDKAVKFILDLDSEKFYEYALSDTTICGTFAITIGIELAKLLNAVNVEKVCFYNSGNITGDYENCVNYIGVVFW